MGNKKNNFNIRKENKKEEGERVFVGEKYDLSKVREVSNRNFYQNFEFIVASWIRIRKNRYEGSLQTQKESEEDKREKN